MYEVSYSSNGGIILPIRYNIGSGRDWGKVMYAHNGEMFANPIKKDTVFYKLSDSHIDSFKKLGIDVELEGDAMRIRGGAIRSAECISHHDHRIAMSLAVTGLRIEGELEIKNRECVAKSYPSFFEDIESLKVR